MAEKKGIVAEKKGFGWIPDVPDVRDSLHLSPPHMAEALPPSVDLREFQPPIFDQGTLGSCTANATAAQCQFLEKIDPYMPSRLFIYYNSRILQGTVPYDSGASIRNSIKSVVNWGYCPEETLPYDISRFTRKPTAKAYQVAQKERIVNYARVPQTPSGLKSALLEGLPVNFGFSVYNSIYNVDSTGILPMPNYADTMVGGHAVLIVGYDDNSGYYTVRNSWGAGWGDNGYFYMPYDYVHSNHLADDFWIVRDVP